MADIIPNPRDRAADYDWPAALYSPRRTCMHCGEPLVCQGYEDVVPGQRTWDYAFPCGCYRGLKSNDLLPTVKKPRKASTKRLVALRKEGPAFAPPLAIAAHSVTSLKEAAAYFRASCRRSEREHRLEAWYAAGGERRVIRSGPTICLAGPHCLRVDRPVMVTLPLLPLFAVTP